MKEFPSPLNLLRIFIMDGTGFCKSVFMSSDDHVDFDFY